MQFITQVVGVPVINSDKVPQFEVRIEHASDSVYPQSGGQSCCATEYRRNSTGAVLRCWGGCCATTGAELMDDFPYFLREKWTPSPRPLPWSAMAIRTWKTGSVYVLLGRRQSGVIMRQSTEAFGGILDCMLALFAFGNMEHYSSCFVPDSYLFYVWVLPCGVQCIGSFRK